MWGIDRHQNFHLRAYFQTDRNGQIQRYHQFRFQNHSSLMECYCGCYLMFLKYIIRCKQNCIVTGYDMALLQFNLNSPPLKCNSAGQRFSAALIIPQCLSNKPFCYYYPLKRYCNLNVSRQPEQKAATCRKSTIIFLLLLQ